MEYLSTLDFLSPLLLQGHVSSNGEAVAGVQFLLYPQQGVKVSALDAVWRSAKRVCCQLTNSVCHIVNVIEDWSKLYMWQCWVEVEHYFVF